MPFTFSHPALALPIYLLYKRAFSLTGLIIGSITPDFEYFFRMEKGTSYYSHTLGGLFYFNLPLGLLLFFLFHRMVRRQLIIHLPAPLYKRFAAFYNLPWTHYVKGRWGIVLLSIFLGAATHLGWDWLVHEHGDFMYEWQHKLLFFPDWQHHSIIYALTLSVHSGVGLAALAIAIWRMPGEAPEARTGNWAVYWGLILLLTLGIVCLRFLFNTSLLAGDLAVSFIGAFLFALLLVSLYSRKGRGS